MAEAVDSVQMVYGMIPKKADPSNIAWCGNLGFETIKTFSTDSALGRSDLNRSMTMLLVRVRQSTGLDPKLEMIL